LIDKPFNFSAFSYLSIHTTFLSLLIPILGFALLGLWALLGLVCDWLSVSVEMSKRGAPQNGKQKTDRLGVYLSHHHPILMLCSGLYLGL